jgi:hypothetical protein
LSDWGNANATSYQHHRHFSDSILGGILKIGFAIALGVTILWAIWIATFAGGAKLVFDADKERRPELMKQQEAAKEREIERRRAEVQRQETARRVQRDCEARFKA